jgi:hypothetical protein
MRHAVPKRFQRAPKDFRSRRFRQAACMGCEGQQTEMIARGSVTTHPSHAPKNKLGGEAHKVL